MEQLKQIKGKAFKRPEAVKLPTVWLRFEGKTARADGTYPKFKIEDVTDDKIGEILENVYEYCKEELLSVTCKDAGEDFAEGAKMIWGLMLKDRVSLQCVTDDEETPRLCGFQINEICSEPKSDKFDNLELMQPRVILALANLKNEVNVFEKWNVDAYMDAVGLFVLPQFRGHGIAYRLLAARRPLCKALGVKATANQFSSEAANRSAAKAGFEMLNSISFQELDRRYGTKLSSAENGRLTFMGMKFE